MPNSKLLPRSDPAEQGVISSNILKFIDAIEKDKLELHSFMLLRHGFVVSEGWWAPYSSDRPHMLFSLSKSFTSTGIGLAVSEGLLSVEDYVISFFPDDIPAVISDNLQSMKVKHLLSMSTGHVSDTIGKIVKSKDGNWVKAFLSLPVDYEPGTHFLYNTGASYMLSAIVTKVTGRKLMDYLRPRLFEPLGITGAQWETCPKGINTGGFGLSIKTEDIAKFGQLYLQNGMWNGVQVIPQEWVEEAARCHISNGNDSESDWAQGYGYQFWRCRHNAYRGDGAFGQYCIVMPEKDAVIAITSGVGDMQAVLNHVWENLLPAMADDKIKADDSNFNALKRKIANLSFEPPKSKSCSEIADKVNGKSYRLDQNQAGIKTISFNFDEDRCNVKLEDSNGLYSLCCGHERWLRSETLLHPGLKDEAIAYTSYTWLDGQTLEIIERLIETPFCITLTCRFDGTDVIIDYSINVSFDPQKAPVINGHMI